MDYQQAFSINNNIPNRLWPDRASAVFLWLYSGCGSWHSFAAGVRSYRILDAARKESSKAFSVLVSF